jgi:hypothetical protein
VVSPPAVAHAGEIHRNDGPVTRKKRRDEGPPMRVGSASVQEQQSSLL